MTTTTTATATAEIYSSRVEVALSNAKNIEEKLRILYDEAEETHRGPGPNPWQEMLQLAVAQEDFLRQLLEREYQREGS